MSLRAELERLGLRWFVKRKIGPATTLEALRRQDAFLARLVPPPPKGTQATHIDPDGVKAVASLRFGNTWAGAASAKPAKEAIASRVFSAGSLMPLTRN
ncbi:MAG TPA: hypothetical protein VGY54_18720 [Polyangiaceae bacterium]|jgi:hypothetical protein|nr:hypothetical protein [Polyangiaceae bacterium]